ncbi:polysaccharide deacetylase family protein [Nostocoides sp. HKS02]|nr:polysaccharide deacetylase family protein [Tetrasphaera sp. HKS02]
MGACSAPGTDGSAATTSTAAGKATPKPSSPSATGSTASASPTGPAPEPAIAKTPGADIVSGPADRNQVALTFHGQGPVELVHSILSACHRADAHITVFAVGNWLEATPGIGREIVAAGHELGNHTWSHQQMKQLSPAEAEREARKGAEALRAAVGTAGWWFRPSGTQHSTATIRAAALAAGYQRCVSYDVDPGDYLDPGSSAVRDRTLAAVKPGSIVSLHFGHPGTATALPAILAGLRSRGLAPVTLSHLLADA